MVRFINLMLRLFKLVLRFINLVLRYFKLMLCFIKLVLRYFKLMLRFFNLILKRCRIDWKTGFLLAVWHSVDFVRLGAESGR